MVRAGRIPRLEAVFGMAVIGANILFASAYAGPSDTVAPRRPETVETIPRPDHVVIVIEENKAYRQIIGNPAAPYINRLARAGALFTHSFAVTHPSQPNYLALFSGATHGVEDNRCLSTLSGANLASELERKGLSFVMYSESLPATGFTGCRAGHYARKHNPAVNWQGVNLEPAANQPFGAFPSDFRELPTVSMVVPNLLNDMHDGPAPKAIGRGDNWLQNHLDPYVRWAANHNSLLILTWDEDDGSSNNRIVTVFVGPIVERGVYENKIDHYDVLRTIIDMYELGPMGEADGRTAVRNIWKPGRSPDRSELRDQDRH